MSNSIQVTVTHKDTVGDIKDYLVTIIPVDKVDINSLIGHISEGVGKALREKSEGYY